MPHYRRKQAYRRRQQRFRNVQRIAKLIQRLHSRLPHQKLFDEAQGRFMDRIRSWLGWQ